MPETSGPPLEEKPEKPSESREKNLQSGLKKLEEDLRKALLDEENASNSIEPSPISSDQGEEAQTIDTSQPTTNQDEDRPADPPSKAASPNRKKPAPKTTKGAASAKSSLGVLKSIFPRRDRSGNEKQNRLDAESIADRLTPFAEPEKPTEESSVDKSWNEALWISKVTKRHKDAPPPTDSGDEASTEDLHYDPEADQKDKATGDTDAYLLDQWVGTVKAMKPSSTDEEELDRLPPGEELARLPSAVGETDGATPEGEAGNEESESQPAIPVLKDAPTDSLDEMRNLALDGLSENHLGLESDSGSDRPLHRRLNKIEQYLLFIAGALVIITLVVLGIAYRRNSVALPAPTATEVSLTVTPTVELPNPVGIQLTGGWYFSLTPSTFDSQGRWTPQRAEWLSGAEVTRVVTLPYTKQLEATVQSFNVGDPIILAFSNHSQLTYTVQSIEQVAVSSDFMKESVPSLLIILYDQNSDKRWLVRCIPQ